MIRVESQSNIDAWKAQQIAYLDSLLDATEDDMLDAATTIVEPRLEAITKTAPPRGDNDFIWSMNAVKNAKARRKWFAMIRKGEVQTDGRHYIRQGKPPYGLRVDVDTDDKSVFIAIYSTWNEFNMIFGSPLTGRGQLPGHRDTRWQLVKSQIDELYADVNAFLLDRHNKRAEAQNRKPTITRFKR